MKKLFLVALLMVAMLVGSSACAAVAEPKMELPEEAIKVSDVIPGMGEHWVDPSLLEADPTQLLVIGPIYMVYKGEVIGIEYMWSEDMMQEVSIPTPEGPEVFNALISIPVGVIVNHADISFFPEGHEEFEFPHWDIHMYFITQEEKAAITP